MAQKKLSPKKNIHLIGYDCGWGCHDYGCEDGPAALDFTALETTLKNGLRDILFTDLEIRNLGHHDIHDSKEKTLPLISEALKRLHSATEKALQDDDFPVIIGGDHSSAMATWSAVTHQEDCEEKLGLIWLDAHMDAHTPKTANEGKWGGWWHGMPVATLLGDGRKRLMHLGEEKRRIAPEHISLIGIRSYEPGEEAFLKEHNIRVYHMDEVEERGFAEIFDESYERATTGTVGYGLSIDLDGFDPADAPGVGTPEATGLIAADVLKSFEQIHHDPLLKALEIVEYNPHNDPDKITASLINKIIFTLLK